MYEIDWLGSNNDFILVSKLIKLFVPTIFAFFLGLIITPFFLKVLIKFKAWKKEIGKQFDLDAEIDNPEIKAQNKKLINQFENKTPRFGGVIIWLSALITTLFFSGLAFLLPENNFWTSLNYLSRDQTWMPLLALILGALIGFIDDLFVIQKKGSRMAGGLSIKIRLTYVLIVSLFFSYWFYFKLGIASIDIPFYGELYLGLFMIPLIISVFFSIFASSIIDGIDGLCGGVLAIIFSSYSFLALINNQINLSVLCGVITASIVAFLWFNVPRAKFYLSETGFLALGFCLAAVVFLSSSAEQAPNGVILLPIIGIVLVASVLSNILQVYFRRVYDRKLFKIAPLHHHLQSVGWEDSAIVMRYWIITIIFSLLGIVISIIG